MRTKTALVAAALASMLLLAACETPTYFQPAANSGGVGYKEMRLEPDRWRVTFQGGGGAPAAQVADYALLRAAQITLRDGDDWFMVTERWGAETGGSGGSVSIGGGGASFGEHSGVGLGVGTSFPLGGGPALTESLEFVEGKGAKPAGPAYYDARGVESEIGPRAAPPPPAHG
ncbi:MAG TPA: hypothetical protein VGS12_17110 [Caulobacteraceae bacterium]|nr:hypothetical protein [Caulobacteraceae bacterium]